MSARARIASLLGAAVVVSPTLAHACAVCMSGREDDVQFAFILTTVLLSVLPLLLIGGVIWWVRRRLRELEEGRATTKPGAMAVPASQPAE